MSILDLLQKKKFRIERVLDGTLIHAIELDAVMSESIGHDTVVTEHPVEEGANVADHVRNEAVKFSLTGMMSNHALVPTFLNLNYTRVQDTYALLKQWQDQAIRLRVRSSLETFDNMLIKSFSVQRAGPQTAHVLPVTIEFKEIRTAQSRLSSAKAPKPKIKKAEPKKQQPKKPPQQRTSVGKQLGSAVSKFLGGR